MPTTLYGLKNCDSCRKALALLAATGAPVQFVDIRQEADLSGLLPEWLRQVGPAALINTRSTTWRALDAATRSRAETDPAGLLMAHPTLIKRPVIDRGGKVTVGIPSLQ